MALKRTVIGGGLNALRGLENIARVNPQDVEHITQYLESKGIKAPIEVPQSNRLSDKILQALNLSEQDIQPQGLAERIGQGLIGAAPFARGGNIGRMVAGQTASSLLGEAQAPEWAQVAAQLATEGGLARHKLKKAGKHKNLAEHTSHVHEQARQALARNEKGSARGVKPFLDKAESLWRKETDDSVRKVVERIADTISSNIDSHGNIDIANAWENKQALALQNQGAKGRAKKYIEEAMHGLDKVLKEHSPANPSFGSKMNEADRLAAFQLNNEKIREYIEAIPLSKASKLIKVPQILEKIIEAPRAIFNPAVRKYYSGLTKSIIEDNKNSAIRYAKLLNDAWQKQESEPENDFWIEIVDETPTEDAGWQEVI